MNSWTQAKLLGTRQFYRASGVRRLHAATRLPVFFPAALKAKRSHLRVGDLWAALQCLIPYDSGHALIRIGGDKDGAYLLPNDLAGIRACFSPGVNTYKRFEDDLTSRGIRCHMCDGSADLHRLETPLAPDHAQTFRKKWLEPLPGDDCISLEQWIAEEEGAAWKSADYILQMHIEGAEYRNLSNLGEHVLSRFRIIVLELHYLDWMIFDQGFLNSCVLPLLKKLSSTHLLVHFHANNVTGTVRAAPDVYIPKIVELTYLRRDRCLGWPEQRMVPIAEDVANVADRPQVELGLPWRVNCRTSEINTALRAFCASHKFDYVRMHHNYLRSGPSQLHRYSIERFTPAAPVSSAMVLPTGRFGNGIRQLLIAYLVAKQSELQRVYIGDFLLRCSYDMWLSPDPVPAVAELRAAGVGFSFDLVGASAENVFVGPFMDPLCFPSLTQEGPTSRTDLSEFVTHVMRPLIGWPHQIYNSLDECAVHIRSGDIFASRPNPWYTQPPLSFYQAATELMMTRHRVTRFKVIFQDTTNPIITPYLEWLDRQGIDNEVVSSAFRDDFKGLCSSKYLITSKGTLCPAAVLLSDGKSGVACYEAFDSLGMPVEPLMSLDISKFVPRSESYIPRGHWRNTPKQRELMVTHQTEFEIQTTRPRALIT
jgi:hypothetical protein